MMAVASLPVWLRNVLSDVVYFSIKWLMMTKRVARQVKSELCESNDLDILGMLVCDS